MTVWTALRRVVWFTLLWVVLVEGDPAYFAYALLTVPVAVAASLVWLPHDRTVREPVRTRGLRRLLALLGLLAWLGVESVRGGVDVARRSLSHPVRVDPVEVVVPVRLAGLPRAVSLGVLGLLPGTIVEEVREHEAVVHTLSRELDSEQTWQSLQRRVEEVVGRAPRQ
jgi:multicomponent Na+:H+ antiporter subunit E